VEWSTYTPEGCRLLVRREDGAWVANAATAKKSESERAFGEELERRRVWQRLERVFALPFDPKRRPARRQNPQRRAGVEQVTIEKDL
jgi:hypothetical protein